MQREWTSTTRRNHQPEQCERMGGTVVQQRSGKTTWKRMCASAECAKLTIVWPGPNRRATSIAPAGKKSKANKASRQTAMSSFERETGRSCDPAKPLALKTVTHG
jgi:hypothetical protein